MGVEDGTPEIQERPGMGRERLALIAGASLNRWGQRLMGLGDGTPGIREGPVMGRER